MSWRDPGGTSVLRKGSLERQKEHMSTPPDSENGFLPGSQRLRVLLSPEQKPGKQQGAGLKENQGEPAESGGLDSSPAAHW